MLIQLGLPSFNTVVIVCPMQCTALDKYKTLECMSVCVCVCVCVRARACVCVCRVLVCLCEVPITVDSDSSFCQMFIKYEM